MKMNRLFSGILAAVISAATVIMPMSNAIAESTGDESPSTTNGTINIKNPHSGGTYTAYPIFTGSVEISTDPETKGRLVIDNVDWHENLAWNQYPVGGTMDLYKTTNSVIKGNPQKSSNNNSKDHVNGLYDYVKTGLTAQTNKINISGEDLALCDLMEKYGYKITSTSITALKDPDKAAESSAYAEEVAKLLNLTNTYSDKAITAVTDTSTFYAAFAEAAVAFSKFAPEGTVTDENGNPIYEDKDGNVVDAETEGAVVRTHNLVSYTFTNGSVTVPQGYYVVEWVPDGEYKETDPRAVRRSLVLVPPESVAPEGVTISPKDTLNVASVDVQFYDKAGTATTEDEDVTGATFPEGGTWQNAVSMESSSYVNCRVVVTLPSNLCDYDQYYLGVPIMYDYNRTLKSLSRVGDDVKVYLIGEDKSQTDIDVDSILKVETDSSAILTLVKETANPTASNGFVTTTYDRFVPAEAFVINDILGIAEIKEAAAGYTSLTLAFEFPVEFARASLYDNGNTFNSIGSDKSGTGVDVDNKRWIFNDDFLKNYITAKAVYSNNPNLEPLTDDDYQKADDSESEAGDSTDLIDEEGFVIDENGNRIQTTTGIKIWADTTQAPGSVYNPVSITSFGYANVVTYRMRIQATTAEILEQYKEKTNGNGICGVQFVLKKTVDDTDYYAVVSQYGTGNSSAHDKVVDGEFGADSKDIASVYAYQITKWVTEDEAITDGGYSSDVIMTTSDSTTISDKDKSGRIEILGVGASEYTLVALNKEVTLSDVAYKLTETEFKVNITSVLNQDADRMYFRRDSNSNSVTSGIVKELEAKTNPDITLGTKADAALVSLRVMYVKKGLTLPVTGGIGTFIFFAVGGALVVISTVAIVTKFRIKREQL